MGELQTKSNEYLNPIYFTLWGGEYLQSWRVHKEMNMYLPNHCFKAWGRFGLQAIHIKMDKNAVMMQGF